MSKKVFLGRVTKGALAGLAGGLVASFAANQFHSLWSRLRGEEQGHPEVAKLSQRGGRPDTAAAKEKVASGEQPQQDATVTIASKVSSTVFDRSLSSREKHRGGVAVHYVFGAASGAFYGATGEIIPLVKVINGLAFGLSIWIVAVEVTLPALKLAAPWKYPFRMHAYSLISHLIFGSVTEQGRKSLRGAA